MERGKRRDFPHGEMDDDHSPQAMPKRTCSSFPNAFGLEAESGIAAEPIFSAALQSQIKALVRAEVREVIDEAVESKFQSHFCSLLSSFNMVQRNMQLNDHIGGEAIAGFGMAVKLKLCFHNQIASTIFTNNEIKAKNGMPLQVALCDVTNNNTIVQTGHLSSARIEFVVLDGNLVSDEQIEEICWTMKDFNKNVLSPRVGKRPLIVDNVIINLENGVGTIKNTRFTDNSSWLKGKKIRLGAKVVDKNIAGRIGEAISQSFRVMDHRGQANKKHHPPNMGDEVWRLEGIGKGGAYHSRLSSENIFTVLDFLQFYQNDPYSLRQLLGNNIPNKIWKMMVENALECDVHVSPMDVGFGQIFVGKEVMRGRQAFKENLKVSKQKNLGDGDEFQETFLGLDLELESMLNFEDPPLLFPHGEASTSYGVGNAGNQCYQGAWTDMVPKPN